MAALTFAADSAFFGNRPLAYGLTNLALAIGCGGLLFGLLRELKLPREAAAFGALVWLLNVHGVSMAMLWISGRTALILTAAALATAIAVIRGRVLLAALCLLVALCSKEEAVALPITLLVWLIALGRDGSGSRRVRPIAWIAVSCVAVGIYAFLRMRSGAMTPASAPWFYLPLRRPTSPAISPMRGSCSFAPASPARADRLRRRGGACNVDAVIVYGLAWSRRRLRAGAVPPGAMSLPAFPR